MMCAAFVSTWLSEFSHMIIIRANCIIFTGKRNYYRDNLRVKSCRCTTMKYKSDEINDRTKDGTVATKRATTTGWSLWGWNKVYNMWYGWRDILTHRTGLWSFSAVKTGLSGGHRPEKCHWRVVLRSPFESYYGHRCA
jgi:hypothetical protein